MASSCKAAIVCKLYVDGKPAEYGREVKPDYSQLVQL